jgi:hypothetical protein
MKMNFLFFQKKDNILFLIRNTRAIKIFSLTCIVMILNISIGCNYYKVTTSRQIKEIELKNILAPNRFIILHDNDKVWQLKDAMVKNDTIYGNLTALTDHEKYKTTKPEKPNRYKKIKEGYVIYELHIYASSYQNTAQSGIVLPLKEVKKIEIYDHDTKTTIVRSVFGTLGVMLLTLGILSVIVLLTKESCPFVYVNDSQNYKFCGEIYSGAIHPPLERDDYLCLGEIKPVNNIYSIKITNEVREIQNTNLLELQVFDHNKNTDILVDKYGKYQTISSPQLPSVAVNLKGKNIFPFLKKDDTLSYAGLNIAKDQDLTDGAILTFNKPQNADSAKLIVRAKNTFWLEYVLNKFYDLFGIVYNKWIEKQKTGNKKEMNDWSLSQNIPLSVYVENNGVWEFADYYNVSGPMAFKDDVLTLSLKNIKTDSVRIKIEYGYAFWDIDYVAIDYSKNIGVNKSTIPVRSATNNNGNDVKNLLVQSDSLYYIQPEIGDEATITFDSPELKNTKRTVVLHSRGHYQILKKLNNIPDKKYLNSFKQAGSLNRFAEELMQKYR